MGLFSNVSELCLGRYLWDKKTASSKHSTPVRHLLDVL